MMNIESVGSFGGWCWEHFTSSPPPHLPSIPAVGVSEGGGGKGARRLFLCADPPTLFRNIAAGLLESNRQGLKCDHLGETSGRTFIWLAQGRQPARTGPTRMC